MGNQISDNDTVDLELPTGEDFEDQGLVELDYAPVVEDLSGDKPADVTERPMKVVKEQGTDPAARQDTQQPPVQGQQDQQQPPVQETQPQPVAPPVTQTARQPEAAPDFITHVVANRASIIEGLAKNHFAPSEAELGLLESDPKKFFGMLRAQTYVDSLLAQSQIMREALPRIIAQQVGQINNESAHETAFFSRHPDLNKPELQEGLVALANGLKASRPDLTRDEFMDTLAKAARTVWGMSAPTQQAPARGQANVTRQRINGFQPAASKSAGTTRQPTQERSQVDHLFDLLRADADE